MKIRLEDIYFDYTGEYGQPRSLSDTVLNSKRENLRLDLPSKVVGDFLLFKLFQVDATASRYIALGGQYMEKVLEERLAQHLAVDPWLDHVWADVPKPSVVLETQRPCAGAHQLRHSSTANISLSPRRCCRLPSRRS